MEAGLVEFGLFGYHGASTTGIAARADVPQPHVYSSFGSKQELFLACWERVHDAVLQNPGSIDALEPIDARDAVFLYQVVASVQDGDLGEELRPGLLELRTVLGEDRLSALLGAGASLLLTGEA